MRRLTFIALCLLSGCGYHFVASSNESVSFSLPEIAGDETGKFSNILIEELVATGKFDYAPHGAHMLLDVHILSDTSDRIDYRYDRDPNSGKLRKNILGTMNRRHLVAEVKLVDARTDEIVWGPQKVYGSADYDYIDPHSLHDLAFVASNGTPHTVLDFSLGQLDSEGGAHIDAAQVAYRHLAVQIAASLIQSH